MLPGAYFVFVLAEGVLVGFTIISLYISVRRTIIKSNNIRKQMMNINIYKKSSNEEITCINTGIKSMLELSENFCENNRHTFHLTEDSTHNSVSKCYTKKHGSFGESPNSKDLCNTDILNPNSLLSNLNGLLIVASSVAGMKSNIRQNTLRSCNNIISIKKKNEISINVTRVTTGLIVISIIFFVTLADIIHGIGFNTHD
ncbi:unnamed protein product [Mytilus edulis]|uniref:Uncharacterized protein n=1 Tax=Mytilus edulis TaxID=6550 RepID=A0A8S3TYA8_MYTED|nr:unnamed protein product [Mytilus edulis]